MRLENGERWELSEFFKSKRIEAGLSQAKLAKLVNSKESTISGIETGKTIPRDITIKQLAEFFKLTSEETQRCINAVKLDRRNRNAHQLRYVTNFAERVLAKRLKGRQEKP